MNDFSSCDISNEEYHRGEKYREYLSSTQLKDYLTSPGRALFLREHPEAKETTPSMALGSLFHSAMEWMTKNKSFDMEEWAMTVVTFDPPINPRTNLPFGSSTSKYIEAYSAFIEEHKGCEISSKEDVNKVISMVEKLINGYNGNWVRSRIKNGTPEMSFFTEYLGQKFKVRTDLITSSVVVDWKTISNLTIKEVDQAIQKYHYDISAAFYQFFLHEITGKWFKFYWVFVETKEPFNNIIVDAVNYTYFEDEEGIVAEGIGAQTFRKLLDEHIKCSESGEFPGIEAMIPEDDLGRSIYIPTPPPYYNSSVQFYK